MADIIGERRVCTDADDLLGVVSPQIDAGAEVDLAEPALGDVQGNTLASKLKRVRAAQLVRREPAPGPGASLGRRNSQRTARRTTVADELGRR